MVTAEQAVALLAELRAAGALAWVDGGWGVDALLGTQTRDHDDLDLVVAVADLPAAVRTLRTAGFAVERDQLPAALALRHPDGRGVDLHPVEPTPDGGGDQVLPEGRWHYPPPVTGRICGTEVTCCSVTCQLAAHTGYQPDDDDRADVTALVARFGLTPPPPYAGCATDASTTDASAPDAG